MMAIAMIMVHMVMDMVMVMVMVNLSQEPHMNKMRGGYGGGGYGGEGYGGGYGGYGEEVTLEGPFAKGVAGAVSTW